MIKKRRWSVLVSSALLAVGLNSLPATTAHAATAPRIILDAAKLSSLRSRAQSGDSEWTALKQLCDNYLTGTVEWPEGTDYPDSNSIGEGYQGSGYLDAVFDVGLCYQVALTVDPSKATQYGAKGVDILTKMSAPAGDAHAVDPLRDDGYGIRNFGVGMAIGYDWFHDAMSAGDRTRVYTSIDRWLDAYESSGFGHEHPQSNYFAGYYAAKALAGLATEGEDPRGAAQWSDFLNRVHGQMVQPYYAANMTGGGWPEGQNYGPLATFNMTLPVIAAKTAKGVDLIHGSAPYAFPSGAANWYIYNVWPSLKRVDDRGTMRTEGEPAPAPVKAVTEMAGLLPTWNDPLAPAFHKFARDVRAANPDGATAPDRLWSDFLFWDDSAPEADYKSKPLASYAQGMEMGAVRSGWDTNAVWGSLNAGPYINYPGASEELFDSGSLAVAHGNTPFLVNAAGQVFRGGVPVDDFVYNDNFGSSSTRGLYNVFYTDSPSPTGQGETSRADGGRTHMGAFDQQQDYTFMRGSHLEDMYPRSGTKTINSWTRDVVYLRPDLFVVYDRTATTSSGVGQWMRFHFAGVPAKTADPSSGVSRYDIGSGSSYAGSISTLLPAGHTEQVTPTIFSGTDVSRIDVKPTAASANNQWLSVVDAAGSPSGVAKATRLSTADGNVLQGAVTGTILQSGSTSYAVLDSTGSPDTPITTPIKFHVPSADTKSIITGLAPSTGYSVTSTPDSTGVVVTVTTGSGSTSTAAGVLEINGTTSDGGGGDTGCGVATDGAPYDKSFTDHASFQMTVDATPAVSTADTGVGLGTNPPMNEGTNPYATAATIRFNSANGHIEARSDLDYPATNISFAAGQKYRFRFVVATGSHTYSAYVTPPGGQEQTIGTNLAFRSNYDAATSLNNLRGAADPDGSVEVCLVSGPS